MDAVAGGGSAALAALMLGGAGVLLLAGTLLTARPPREPLPDLDGYFDRWQRVHGDYDPRTGSVWLRGWLIMVHRLARPLAGRGVAPDLLTAWTVWLAAAVVVAAVAGAGWVLLAGWLVLLSGLADGLDGAVAVLTRRTTPWGYVLDSVADRVTEILFLVAAVAVGAPGWLAVTCGAGFLVLEYLRARAANAGGGEVGVITVGERANRVALCAVGIHFAGIFATRAGLVVTAALALLAGLTFVGLAQLLVAVRRDLSAPGR